MARINNVVSIGLLALSTSIAYSGTMGPVAPAPAGKIYLGVFGGGGSLSSTDISQYGTAFFTEAEGGPLAVNAFGTSNSNSMGMVGGHIGFAWSNLGLNYPVMPAVELEGYYIGGAEIQGNDINNDTVRLPEHNFLVTYPLKTGVFLVNAILSSNNAVFGNFRPYVGVGIGSALVSISGASAFQIDPPEVGVNHYDADTSSKAFSFATQPKIGLSYDLSSGGSVFAEYRYLYISQSSHTFGSTIAAGHAPTSPWLAHIRSQSYNMGTVGINFDL